MKCIGTSTDESYENRSLRDQIIQKQEVVSLFGTFTLEDGSGKVVLDSQKALNHVTYVLNDIRRSSSTSRISMLTKVRWYAVLIMFSSDLMTDWSISCYAGITRGHARASAAGSRSKCDQ